jgi:hypothetical protein
MLVGGYVILWFATGAFAGFVSFTVCFGSHHLALEPAALIGGVIAGLSAAFIAWVFSDIAKVQVVACVVGCMGFQLFSLLAWGCLEKRTFFWEIGLISAFFAACCAGIAAASVLGIISAHLADDHSDPREFF